MNIIKFVSIPEEIKIYKCHEEELIQLENNSYIFSDYDYILKPNLNLTKTSQYYYIDYQYFVEDSDFQPSGNTLDEDSLDEYLAQSNVYYGRINRLQFKLCHKYCETCNELGVSDDDQKCSSCLSIYQYDYWYFYNNTQENCVPENYYIDIENNTLIKCDPNIDKYYHNITDNKTICFKNDFDCPSSHPYLNEKTNECFNNDSDNEIISKISSSSNENTNENEAKSESSKLNNDNINETNNDKENYNQGISSSMINQTRNECLICDYNCYKKGGCSFDNYNISEDVYDIIKSNFISEYKGEEGSLKVSNGNKFVYQITTVKNELDSLTSNTKSDLSIIDLKGCSDLLKAQNGIDSNVDLVILKYENEDSVSNGNEKSIQYEVYLPNSAIKLNLSVCSNININIYVPIKLNEETQKLYDDLKEQGYNLFDKNDKFYKDICTPYKSENGTDVLLSDRYNDFFVANQLTCQSNCEYSDYLPNSQYLKCECDVVDKEKIETKEPEKITAKSIGKSFSDILKYSNYKVLFCYKLVFRNVTFTKNVGSILTLIYFIGYLIAFGLFCYGKLIYLKDEIEKLFNNYEGKDKNLQKDGPIIFIKNNIFPTENLQNKNKIKENLEEKNKDNNENKEEKETVIRKNKKSKTKISKKKKKSIINSKNNNRINMKKIIEIKRADSLKVKANSSFRNMFDDESIIASKDKMNNKLSILDKELKNIIDKKLDINSSKIIDKGEVDKKKEILNDYELNDLEYLEALELDNRNFLRIYWYLLKREHLILFTFFNWNDLNIFSIKLTKFFLSICSDMAFNVFFFSDESMHNIYTSGGEHDFIGQLAQMIYSTIISQILQTIINYLTMTDIPYYQIKELMKDNNINKKQATSIMNCIKYKIIIFYSFTFLLFLFFWYLISAFCAVYENTQRIFVTDSLSSFIMGLLYPFLLYLIPTALRLISLTSKEKKNLKILYSLSDKIPLF